MAKWFLTFAILIGVILSVAVLQAERKPALSEAEGDLPADIHRSFQRTARKDRLTMLKTLAVALSLAAATAAAQSLPQMRMTPTEMRALTLDNNQVGSSKVPGVHTKVLAGDPTKPGFYAILLFVPAHTTIQAHSHRDDRMASVLAGEWHFGYGDRFEAQSLKTLPPGSVYSEPGGVNHFARSDADPVIVQVSGYGPTDTHYFDPANDPSSKNK